MAGYPELSALLADRSRRSTFCVHRSLLSILSLFAWCGFWVFVIYSLDWYLSDFTPPDWLIVRHLSLRWLALIPSLLLLEILRRRFDNLWVFERKQVKHLGGRLSLHYFQPTIRYSDVRAITVHQGLLDRLLNVGDVQVETAGTDQVEMVLSGVRAPHELAFLIDRLRRSSQEDSLND